MTCRRRGGYSLLEMAVVIGLISFVLSTTAVVLHSAYRIDRQVRLAMHGATAIERLSLQLRSDAHAAVAVAPDEPADNRQEKLAEQLTLVLPQERTVQYESAEAAVVRIVRQGEQVEHREMYRLPGQSARWHRDESGPQPLVVLVLTRGDEVGNEIGGAGQRIEAAVGLDRYYGVNEMVEPDASD